MTETAKLSEQQMTITKKILFQHFIRNSFYRAFNFTQKGNKDVNISDAHFDTGKSTFDQVVWSDTTVSEKEFDGTS